MKRLSLVLSLLLAAGALVFAGGGTQAPAGGQDSGALKPASLRIWAHWGSEQRRPTIEKMIALFNQTYAAQGIKAEYVYVPFGELETKLVAAITGGNPPDVVISAIEAVNIKAMRRQAADITAYIEPSTPGKFYDLYWQTALYNDRVYALPFNTDTRFIFYNKRMFEEAGVNPDTIKTWADLIAAGDRLDAKFKGTGNYKMAFSPVIGNFGFDTVALSNGGTIFDNPMNPSRLTLNNKAHVEALEYIRTWNERYGKTVVQGLITNTGSGTQDPFISGQVAMFGQMCNYIATLERYARDDSGKWILEYGTIPMPTGPSYTGGARTSGGGFVALVPFGSKNPREAAKLAEFMSCGEGANIWAVEQKDVMCSIAANAQPQLAGSIGWDRTLEMLPVTQINRRHIYAPDAATIKDTQVFRIIREFENVPAQTVLDEAVKQIDAMIASERAIFGE